VVALALAVVATATVGWLAPVANARGGAASAPLSSMPVPTPANIANFVQNNAAAVKLGKAFFWDMQAGSDGHQACASCHFNAGADNRSRNQLNPRKPTSDPAGFDFKGPNAQLSASDFPFHKLADPTNAASAVISDTSNVAGSQGVIPSKFLGVTAGQAADNQDFAGIDDIFKIGSVNVRRTTGRNTPSAINAVFNFRNFWDGRAQNEFNGVDPFGARDTSAQVGLVNPDGTVAPISLTDAAAQTNGFTLNNSSLASQAVGPPGNNVEMSSDGRTLADIGKKLLSLRPLGEQQVSPSDSVLGTSAAPGGKGLNTNYAAMIRAAFKSQWWNSNESLTAGNGKAYPLMQFNFALFWGLAIQAYEATLVSDQAPVDRFLSGDPNALSPAAQQGMGIFNGQGKCASCHGGPAFTDATVQEVGADGVAGATVDTGFANIGVRPTADDPGIDGKDPFGASLSEVPNGTQVGGAFKVPDLRNVALTAPYFHNGGQMTLRQVVDFYSRGGDFANPQKDADISALNLTSAQKDDVVAFLESLTDPRVKNQSAPFDHPQLFVPVGEKTNANGSIVTANGRAADCFKEVAATGAGGGAPLTPFPNFTGPPCSSFPAASPAPRPAPRPAAPVTVAPKPPVQAPKAPTPTLRLGHLTLNRRLSLRALRVRGIRVTVTVPLNTRAVTLRLTRSGRVVATKRIRVATGGRITVVWHPSKQVLRKLRRGGYRVVVFASPSASRTGIRMASARLTLTG
jgi:cytochrome c peroxidase